MDGASAMKLATRLSHIVDVYPTTYDADGNANPVLFRSSLMRNIEKERVTAVAVADENDFSEMSVNELERSLIAMDPAGDFEIETVTG